MLRNVKFAIVIELGSFLPVANEDNTKQRRVVFVFFHATQTFYFHLFNSDCSSLQLNCNVISFAILLSIQ